jgi:hypothetical protein
MVYCNPTAYTTKHGVLVPSSHGTPRREMSMQDASSMLYHPKLRYNFDRFKCEHFQKHKLSGKGYSLLLEWEMQIALWEEVATNLIVVSIVNANNQKGHCLKPC